MHPSLLHLGYSHIPVFGVFAALGLMAALALSQRTARYARLAPEAVWNAGMSAILSAFVISRLLLVLFNARSFVQYPLLILALPSLTSTGILLTVLFMAAYTRWRKLPVLLLLDAIAPCAALAWIFLTLGHYFEGTRDGMPAYSLFGASSSAKMTPQPVELLTAIGASLVFVGLLKTLSNRRIASPAPAGRVAAIGLISSGSVIFLVDFLRIPSELFDRSMFDPSQIIGIAMILAGAAFTAYAGTQIKQESGNEPPHAV